MLLNWMEQAACTGWDREKFFDLYLQSEEVALEVNVLCVTCPVNLQCYAYGVETKSTGIWGGKWLTNGKRMQNRELIAKNYFSED